MEAAFIVAIILGVASLILLFILIFLFRIGIFSEYPIKDELFPGGHFIFTEYQGDYRHIGHAFTRAGEEMVNFMRLLPDTYMCGIYLDDPALIREPDQCRAIIGVIIPPTVPKEDVDKLNPNGKFQYKFLPPAPSLVAIYPYRNTLGFVIMRSKIGKMLARHIADQHIIGENESSVIFEVYKWQYHPNPCTETRQIFGIEAKEYQFSSYPDPEPRETA